MDLNLIESSLEELELLKDRITELGENTDVTYVKNHTRCMKSDIEDIIVHLKVFLELNRSIAAVRNELFELEKFEKGLQQAMGVEETEMTNNLVSGNTVVVGGEVVINGVKMPPCPSEGRNSTIIGDKVYIDGYELVNGKWKKTLKALWHKWF